MSFINTLRRFERDKLIHCPKFLIDNTQYLTQMGSVAYGVSNDNSDIDIYGFCVPPREILFPHLAGEIVGFGTQLKRFNEYQQHHIVDSSSQKEYDITIYNIVKYFSLCMDNNPNLIDSLFTPRCCILHSTAISEILLENRKLFLHKGAWSKFKGYAYAQMSKIDKGRHTNLDRPYLERLIDFENKHNIPHSIKFSDIRQEFNFRTLKTTDISNISVLHNLTYHIICSYFNLYKEMIDKNKRLESIKLHSYDVKFALHLVRLLGEVEQILLEGDLDLERNREQLKSIRRGEWTLNYLKSWFQEKEKHLEEVYINSKLQAYPNENTIKKILINCLEHHYGSLDKVVSIPNREQNLIQELDTVLERYR